MRKLAGIVLAVWLTAMAAGCAGADVQRQGPDDTAESQLVGGNNLALSDAADKVDAIVHPRFDRWFSGIELDHMSGTMTVYRKPGSGLDEAIRADIGSGFRIVFRDADMAESEMTQVASRITAERDYWSRRGILVTSSGPAHDGSGVRVTTADGRGSAELSDRYHVRVITGKGNFGPQ